MLETCLQDATFDADKIERFCAALRPGDPKPEDTSHTWDGDITEYNKPLPRWWINLFYLTIVFAIGYLLWYPGMGAFAGYGKWSSQREHAQKKATIDARLAMSEFKGRIPTTGAR